MHINRFKPLSLSYQQEKIKLYAEKMCRGSYISIKNNELWIRLDKVQWAIQHSNPKTWAFFVYKDKILRFCVNEAVDFPIEERKPNDVKERYHIIPQSEAFEFRHLTRRKET